MDIAVITYVDESTLQTLITVPVLYVWAVQ